MRSRVANGDAALRDADERPGARVLRRATSCRGRWRRCTCRSCGTRPCRHPTACASSSWPPRSPGPLRAAGEFLDQRQVRDPARLRDLEDPVVERGGLRRRARLGDRRERHPALARVHGRADRDALRDVQLLERSRPRDLHQDGAARGRDDDRPVDHGGRGRRDRRRRGRRRHGVGIAVGRESAPLGAAPRTRRPRLTHAPCGRGTSRSSVPVHAPASSRAGLSALIGRTGIVPPSLTSAVARPVFGFCREFGLVRPQSVSDSTLPPLSIGSVPVQFDSACGPPSTSCPRLAAMIVPWAVGAAALFSTASPPPAGPG